MTIKNLGFIGIGNMGSRMVPHIVSTGVSIHIYDINKEASSNLARTHNNIVAVNNAAAVAEAADAVITMLPAGPDVKECALGKAGLIEGFSKGDILIDMSSSQPWMTLALSKTLAKKGIHMIDAPVSGGTLGASNGTLTLMIGGPDDIVEQCLSILDSMASHIYRTGDVGSGHALKTLNNLLSGLNTVAAAETLMIGTRFGLDPSVMCEVINESTGMNSATKRNMRQQVISREFGGGFSWDLKFKDYKIAMELARVTETPVPFSSLGFQLYEAANTWIGDTAKKQSIEWVRWYEHFVGSEIRLPANDS
tara:strand:- start:6494 stop:7417 length:924 start_codon:yes stop_codon:yes gene_type:complete